jgi:CheY-like chemotaxis protein
LVLVLSSAEIPVSPHGVNRAGDDTEVVPTRALLVDDNVEFLGVARRFLERDGLEVVAVASTGEQAIRLAEQLRPEVVLVDINLGGESGFDVCRQLNDDAGVESTLILISTHAEEDFADLVAQSPALGFLSKSRLSAAAVCDLLATTRDGPER